MAIAQVTKPEVREPALSQHLTALAFGLTRIVEIAICAECGARYRLDQVCERCYTFLHECPKCHNKVRPRGILDDTCPDCYREDESQIILKQPGHICNGLIVQKKEEVRVEQT